MVLYSRIRLCVYILSFFVTFALILIGATDTSFAYLVSTKAPNTLYVSASPTPSAAQTLPFLAGVNFGVASDDNVYTDPNFLVYNRGYTYSSARDYAYFAGKKVNYIRLAFVWERVQNTLTSNYNTAELDRIDASVQNAASNKEYILLDVHNFGRYSGQIITGPNLLQGYANLWTMLATRYKNNKNVLFDVMNEPHDMTTNEVFAMLQTAITAIRNTGATNTIFVEGNNWSHATTWVADNNNLLQLQDPLNNLVFEPHEYLDPIANGVDPNCVTPQQMVENVSGITAWAKTNHVRILLGETAGINNEACQAAFTAVMNYIYTNSDVWVGFSWWDADPWNSVHGYELEPTYNASGQVTAEAPQISWLQPYWSSPPVQR